MRLEQLEDRSTPALASSAGVVYFLDDATGAVRDSYPLDPAFRGPLFVAGLPDGDVLIGAGAGGGPRVVRWDYATGREQWSVFVGDPASRTGVSVSAWDAYTRTGLSVRNSPNFPADPAAVAAVVAEASRLPDGLEAWLAPNVDIQVQAAQNTPPGGSYYPGERVIRLDAGAARYTRHEVGHAVQDNITAAEYARWLELYSRIEWETFPAGTAPLDYFRLQEWEAFAHCFDLWAGPSAGSSLTPDVRGYFDGLARAHGW